jgi:hypothetical protein
MMVLFLIGLTLFFVAMAWPVSLFVFTLSQKHTAKPIPDYDRMRNLEHDIYQGQEELLLHFPYHGQMSCGHCRSYLAIKLQKLKDKGYRCTRAERDEARRLQNELAIDTPPSQQLKPKTQTFQINHSLDTLQVTFPPEVPNDAHAETIYGDGQIISMLYTWYDVKTGRQFKYMQPISARASHFVGDQPKLAAPGSIWTRTTTGSTGPR